MNSTASSKKPTYPGFGIDFITTETAADGTSLVKQTNFDCHHEDYDRGVERGTRMVYQIMAALERMPDDGTPDGLVRSVIEEAVSLSEAEDQSRKSLRGVAIGVLIYFDELLVEIARTGQWRTSMVKHLNSELAYLKHEHDAHVQATMEFMADLGASQIELADAPAPEADKDAPPASRLPRTAIKEINSLEMEIRHLSSVFQADGRLVDVLDYTADLYKEAGSAVDSDTALSVLVAAESFLHGAWAIATDHECGNAALAKVLTSVKARADKLSNSFDVGGAYFEKQARAPRAVKMPAQQATRTAVPA